MTEEISTSDKFTNISLALRAATDSLNHAINEATKLGIMVNVEISQRRSMVLGPVPVVAAKMIPTRQ